MLTIDTFFQSVLRFCSKPALHDWQLKHRMVGSLFQASQSGLVVLGAFAGFVQVVGFSYIKPQSVDGLQHPDCTKHVDKSQTS